MTAVSQTRLGVHPCFLYRRVFIPKPDGGQRPLGVEARRFWTELRERFAEYGLELHPQKTRLIEFGRYAAANRKRAGKGRPETFDFLGFTHVCGKTRKGRFALVRLTMRKRLRAKLREVKEAFKWRWHDPVPVPSSDPRQKPSAVVPGAGICAGGAG
jgi:hypothetical protein